MYTPASGGRRQASHPLADPAGAASGATSQGATGGPRQKATRSLPCSPLGCPVGALSCDGAFLSSAGGNLCAWKDWRVRNAEQRGPVLRVQSNPEHRLWHEGGRYDMRGGTAAPATQRSGRHLGPREHRSPRGEHDNCLRPAGHCITVRGIPSTWPPHLLVAGGRDHFNTSGIISVWSLEGDKSSALRRSPRSALKAARRTSLTWCQWRWCRAVRESRASTAHQIRRAR